MNLNKTSLAGAAVAVSMLVPMAVSAHGLDLKGHGGLGIFLGLGHNKEDLEASSTVAVHHDGDRDNDEGHDKALSATSSSKLGTSITRQGVRIQNTADFLGTLSPVLAQKIANSTASASSTAAAQTKLTDYNSALAGANTNAQAAITLGGTLASSTGTTTDLAAQARTDLKVARDFLQQARQDLIAIVHTLWGIATHI